MHCKLEALSTLLWITDAWPWKVSWTVRGIRTWRGFEPTAFRVYSPWPITFACDPARYNGVASGRKPANHCPQIWLLLAHSSGPLRGKLLSRVSLQIGQFL